jgi:uncharacterized membrane protein (UPF0127 family)
MTSLHVRTNAATRSARHLTALDEGVLSRFVRWLGVQWKDVLGNNSGFAKAGDENEGVAADACTEVFEAVNITKGVVVAARVEWAGTSEARRRGLLGRDHIDPSEGAYIVPTQWIHMFGMRFPIDVAFLGDDGRVLHVCHALDPNHLSPIVWRAEGALELAAGTLERTKTEIGDIIELR